MVVALTTRVYPTGTRGARGAKVDRELGCTARARGMFVAVKSGRTVGKEESRLSVSAVLQIFVQKIDVHRCLVSKKPSLAEALSLHSSQKLWSLSMSLIM